MKKIPFPFHKFSRQLWLYGFYALLCQMLFLFLFLTEDVQILSSATLLHKYLPLLEYPIMSFSLLIGGALFYDYIVLSNP